MNVLFVVQRYGERVAGGAEQACRSFTERLAGRGHSVEVVSSRATSYVDWSDDFPEGTTIENGVVVHRLSVDRPRRNDVFTFLNGASSAVGRRSAPVVQRDWILEGGPRLPELGPWVRANAGRFDVAVFFTYLYLTTWEGLRAAAPLVPTVLHPTAHDEPYLSLPLFDEVFRLPDALALFTPEEGALIQRRFRHRSLTEEIGIGLDPPVEPTDPAVFRDRYGIGERPYVVYLGRVDPGKGSDEVVRHFHEYKRRRGGDLALVIVGDPVTRPQLDDDVVMTGFVDEADKSAALAGALALVQPSYFESFSLALVEAWQHGIPALVQGHTEVLVGQAHRSGGAIPYRGYAEFEVALDRLRSDAGLRGRLGEAGRRYVDAMYRWPQVLERYESLLERVASSPHSSRSSMTPRNRSASSG